MLRQNVNSPIYLAIMVMLALFLSALAAPVNAADGRINFIVPETRAENHPDGSVWVFDAVTELQRVEIGCGLNSGGPYTDYHVEVPHTPGDPVPTGVDVSTPMDTTYYCIGYVVDMDNRVSDKSAEASFDWVPPPGPLSEIHKTCYGNCNVQINIKWVESTQ